MWKQFSLELYLLLANTSTMLYGLAVISMSDMQTGTFTIPVYDACFTHLEPAVFKCFLWKIVINYG